MNPVQDAGKKVKSSATYAKDMAKSDVGNAAEAERQTASVVAVAEEFLVHAVQDLFRFFTTIITVMSERKSNAVKVVVVSATIDADHVLDSVKKHASAAAVLAKTHAPIAKAPAWLAALTATEKNS